MKKKKGTGTLIFKKFLSYEVIRPTNNTAYINIHKLYVFFFLFAPNKYFMTVSVYVCLSVLCFCVYIKTCFSLYASKHIHTYVYTHTHPYVDDIRYIKCLMFVGGIKYEK